MLKPKLTPRAMKLLVLLLSAQFLALVSGKVETSFQGSQYSYYTTPAPYQFPDLTKTAGSGEISHNPVLQEPLLSQSTVQQPVQAGVPNQHVYYYETYPMQDSSRGNNYLHGGAGTGNKRCTVMGNGNMRCYSRQDTTGFSDYDTTGDDGGSGAGLGGLAGLIGLLGLKGIKGLASVISPIIFPILFPLLLPILLPLLLPLLLLLLIPILLLPIPVISVPAAGRNLQVDFSAARKMATSAFERVVSSDECVERISCEISRMSKGRKAGEWVEKVLGFLPEKNPLTKRIFKGFSMYSNETSSEFDSKSESQSVCSRLKCKMMRIFDSPTG